MHEMPSTRIGVKASGSVSTNRVGDKPSAAPYSTEPLAKAVFKRIVSLFTCWFLRYSLSYQNVFQYIFSGLENGLRSRALPNSAIESFIAHLSKWLRCGLLLIYSDWSWPCPCYPHGSFNLNSSCLNEILILWYGPDVVNLSPMPHLKIRNHHF
jgi:hypothetical protein